MVEFGRSCEKDGKISLDAVEEFLLLAETGNMAVLAKNTQKSKAGVSRRLRALEGLLGVPLLERRKRRLALTPKGIEFLERVRDLTTSLRATISGFQKQSES